MSLLKSPSRNQAASLILGSVVFADVVAWWVLGQNLKNGVYPHDADAIMIPLVFTIFNSMFVAVPGVTGALLLRHRTGWRLASRMLLLLACLFSIALAVYWWQPHHFTIGAAFTPAVGACAWALWQVRP